MFEPSSRYATLTVKTLESAGPDGEARNIRYVERRFLPPANSGVTVAEHPVAQGERIDTIAARYLGDPLQFWRIVDANDVMRPEELTSETGRRVRIALPGF